MPGAILTNERPGAHLMCHNTRYYDKGSSFYLLNHPNLKWVATDSIATRSLPGTIRTSSDTYPFYFGRIFHEGAYRLGKVHAGTKSDQIYIETSTQETGFRKNFEVLTCENIIKTTEATTTEETTTTTNLETTSTTSVPSTTTITVSSTLPSTFKSTTTRKPTTITVSSTPKIVSDEAVTAERPCGIFYKIQCLYLNS